jgi:hypothetical protein
MHLDTCLSIRAVTVQLNFDKQWQRPEVWPNNWILHHDNAPALKMLSVEQFLTQKSVTEMEYPLWSPDLDLNNFWLFPKMKSALKGPRFQDIEDIRKNVMTALKAIPWQEFQKCHQQWQNHWAKCIAAQGEYSSE